MKYYKRKLFDIFWSFLERVLFETILSMENFNDLITYLNDNNFISGVLLLILGMSLPSIFQFIMKFFREDKNLIVRAGIYNIFQARTDLPNSELEKLIKENHDLIRMIKTHPIMSKEKGNEKTLNWLQENIVMYEAHLSAKDGIAHLDNLLQIKAIPKENGGEFKITNITFLYDHSNLLNKLLVFLKIKKKINAMKNLPLKFHETYRNKIITQIDPLIIRYSIDQNFIENYLGSDLLDIILTDSADNEWFVSRKEIEKIKDIQNDPFIK